MRKYNCTIKLCDNTGMCLTEVNKTDIRATDVLVMIHKHGEENVTKLVDAGEAAPVKGRVERERLALMYGEKIVGAVFGPTHQKLPQELDLDEEDEDEVETPEDDEEPGDEEKPEAPDLEPKKTAKKQRLDSSICNK